jgi:hypothetical protein
MTSFKVNFFISFTIYTLVGQEFYSFFLMSNSLGSCDIKLNSSSVIELLHKLSIDRSNS